MSELQARTDGALVEHVPPAERGRHIAALSAAAEHARKVGDYEAFREATARKLAEQAGAALDYSALFPSSHAGPGRGHVKPSTDSVDGFSRGDWLRQIGISDQTIRRWRDWIDDAAREARVEALVAKMAKLVRGDMAASYSSETNEWYTPAVYVEAVRELYGGEIDLDPATCVKANETVQASQIFTLGDDALAQDWHGRAFLNPPYGTEKGESVAGQFCRKAIAEHEAGRLEACVVLVNSVHSQKWQAPLYAWPVCFVDHRICFVNGRGEANENPTFQNIFVYVGDDVRRFGEVFAQFGYVMRRVV